MGSHKQAVALIKIANGIRRRNHEGDHTPAEVAAITARILEMPQSEVRAKFDELNSVTGFDRFTSPATIDQRRRISQLEIGVYGRMRTTYRDELTFTQASERIEDLAKLRAEAAAGVRAAGEFANTHSSVLAEVGLSSLIG